MKPLLHLPIEAPSSLNLYTQDGLCFLNRFSEQGPL